MQKMLLALIAGFLLIAAFNGLAQEQVEAPTYQKGDFWQFRAIDRNWTVQSTDLLDGDYEVSYLEGKLKFLKIEGNQKVEMNLGGSRAELRRMVEVKDSWQYLKFPLFVGQKWDLIYYVQQLGAGSRRYSRSAENRVTKIDEVTVPAGTFRAFKIEREAWSTDLSGGPVRRYLTYYYSALTRSIVKFSYHEVNSGQKCCEREIELIKFGSAP